MSTPLPESTLRTLPPGVSATFTHPCEDTSCTTVVHVVAGARQPHEHSAPTTWTDAAWMQTFTGKAFRPTAPDPAAVDPVDIAHSLSMLCRYNGHVSRFYSVAEHCVLMSMRVPAEDALPTLLHDATEAYVGDMIRPLKHQPQMAAYRVAEDAVWDAIAERFGIDPVLPPSVKAADTAILQDERHALLTPPPHAWDAVEDVAPLGVTIQGWDPATAKRRYLARLLELGVAL